MPGHIETQQLFFRRQLFPGRPVRKILGNRLRPGPGPRLHHFLQPKQRPLPPLLVPGHRGGRTQGRVQLRGQPRPVRGDGIEGAASDQTLQRLLVDRLVLHPGTKILDRLERPATLPGLDQRIHARLADVFHRPETEKNLSRLHREPLRARVHVRGQNPNPHPLGLRGEQRDLVGVIQFVRQQGSHVLRGMVGFQVGRLAGHHRIGRTVTFVESITGKFLQQFKDSQRLRPRDLVHLGATLHKRLPLLGHFLRLLLSHRPS